MSRFDWSLRHLGFYGLAACFCLAFTVYELYEHYQNAHAPFPSLLNWVPEHQSTSTNERLPFQVSKKTFVVEPIPILGLIGDAELRPVMKAVYPYFDRQQMMNAIPVGSILHALRLWGSEATFKRVLERPAPTNGAKMLAIALEHDTFMRNCHLYGPGMLRRSEFGIEVITKRDFSFEYSSAATHFGELSSVLAEIGVPADQPVHTLDAYDGMVAEIIADDAARCVSGTELEWVTCTLSCYAVDNRKWTNRFGEVYSFDRLAQELLVQPIGVGACSGTHVPYALMTLLRADDRAHLVSATTKRSIENYFVNLCVLLTERQTADGCWTQHWESPSAKPLRNAVQMDTAEFMGAVRATGHHLEWMALAQSPNLRPSNAVARRAVTFLLGNWSRIETILNEDWHEYGNVSHVARCLSLLSGYPSGRAFLDAQNAHIKERIQE